MAQQEPSKHAISSSLDPPTARRRGFVRSNMLLIGVFAAGILGVYVLGLREPPQTASCEQQVSDISAEIKLEDLVKNNPADETKPRKGMGIVDTFYYQARQRQIPIEALVGNPFVSRSPRLAVPVAPKPKTKGNERESDSLTEAIKRVKELKLQSVMVGSDATTAIVSGGLLTEGQQILGWTVVQIGPRRVVLMWRDHKYVLEMLQ